MTKSVAIPQKASMRLNPVCALASAILSSDWRSAFFGGSLLFVGLFKTYNKRPALSAYLVASGIACFALAVLLAYTDGAPGLWAAR